MKLTRTQLEMFLQVGAKTYHPHELYSVWELGRLNTALSLQRLGLVTVHPWGDSQYVDKHSFIEITDAGREAYKAYKGGTHA